MLSTFTKVFEKLLLKKFMIISKVHSQNVLQVFTKTTSLKNTLLVMIEKWKAILSKKLKLSAFLWICEKHLIP